MTFGPARVLRMVRQMLVMAFVASCMGAVLPSASAAAEAPTPDERALLAHLVRWHLCHGMQLLDPDWVCGPVADAPPAFAALADQLHALSRLEGIAALARETGQTRALGPMARCAIAMSTEVKVITSNRIKGRARGGGWIESFCQGVVMPDWPADHPEVEPSSVCAYAMDADRRLDGAGLARCVRTLANARLAEAGIGPALARPNIIVILNDDQRWDTIDATHSPMPAIGMPAMPATFSRLAGEGVTFTQAVVTTPICGPSRGSYFTGLHTHRHGMLANGGPNGVRRFDDADTLATRLDAAGYRTAFMGKYTNAYTDLWTPGLEAPYTPPGWDEFYAFDHAQSVPQTRFSMVENGLVVSYDTPEQPYSTDVLAAKAVAFIEESATQTPDEPFALWISTTAPHFPWDPAPRHFGAFDALELVFYPNSWEADVADKPPWLASQPTMPTGLQLFGHWNLRANQLEMQLSVDEMVALLVDELEARGVGDDTIIVYTSDNGHGWGEHRWVTKGCPWEQCLKVPMLVRYPRLVPGPRMEDALVANVDLVPSLLGLAGASMRDDLDGVDLGAALRGLAKVPERDVLFEAYTGQAGSSYAGVRNPQFKFVLYQGGFEELYDLDADPWELENVATLTAYQETREAMLARLRQLWPGFAAVTAAP